MRLACVVAAATMYLANTAHAAEARAVVASAQQRIESTDARATGRLVRVDASGKRISNSFSIKAHWFPGVLRVLLEIAPARSTMADATQDARSGVLLEMRPNGQSTIRIFHPHEAAPVSLAFAKWDESVFGTDFNYEDFLQPEYYWKSQTILKTAAFGTRSCDVLNSTAGAANRSHYLQVQTWIDQTTGYPVYVEKTLKDSGVVKEFTSSGLTQSGGVWAARQVEVKTHGLPGSTLLVIERGSTRANLTLKDFSPEQIEKFEDHH